MRISIRNERGQAVMEYILVLIIAVAIIFGGLYQLNTAFKAWASNYFGDYLSCLLETGELPSIGGTGGDVGTCNRLFKPFSIAEGRRLAAVGKTSGGGNVKVGSPIAATERGSGYGGGGYNGTPFTGGRTPIKPPGNGNGGGGAKPGPINTGSTEVSNYGSGYTSRLQIKPSDRILLDKASLVDQQRIAETKIPSSVTRSVSDSGLAKPPLKVRAPQAKRDVDANADSGFTIADFLRFLLIAAIIIALLLFLGGQALQIGKSMD